MQKLAGVLKLYWVRKVEVVVCVEMIQKESLRMRRREKWWADGEKVREGELAQRGSHSESHGSTAFLGGKINQTTSQVHNMDQVTHQVRINETYVLQSQHEYEYIVGLCSLHIRISGSLT